MESRLQTCEQTNPEPRLVQVRPAPQACVPEQSAPSPSVPLPEQFVSSVLTGGVPSADTTTEQPSPFGHPVLDPGVQGVVQNMPCCCDV